MLFSYSDVWYQLAGHRQTFPKDISKVLFLQGQILLSELVWDLQTH